MTSRSPVRAPLLASITREVSSKHKSSRDDHLLRVSAVINIIVSLILIVFLLLSIWLIFFPIHKAKKELDCNEVEIDGKMRTICILTDETDVHSTAHVVHH